MSVEYAFENGMVHVSNMFVKNHQPWQQGVIFVAKYIRSNVFFTLILLEQITMHI
jgi:hypothetical protein